MLNWLLSLEAKHFPVMGTEELIASGTPDRGDPGEDSLMYEVLLGRKSL